MRTVVFDMDGVIFDTERMVLRAWLKTAPKFGFDNIEEVFYGIVGTNAEYTARMFYRHYGDDAPYTEFRTAARAEFKAYADRNGLPVKEGARELLEYLKENGYKIGLASSTRIEVVSSELKSAQLYDCFDVVIGGDMVEKSKPEPDIYLKACEMLGANPKTTYAVEDSFNGVKAASSAGLITLMVPDMLEPDDEIRSRAKGVFENLNKVKEYLEMNPPLRIIAATGNKGKLREIKRIFPEFEIISQSEAGIDIEPEENGSSFEENALIKARAVHGIAGGYTLADDSGLCVDALDGAPGIYSARYAGEGAGDKERIEKLLKELDGKSVRSAHFETCAALITPEGREITASGTVDGRIISEPRGENGFGYDPVFECEELGKTFAEADEDEKNAVSHRGRALRKLYKELEKSINV